MIGGDEPFVGFVIVMSLGELLAPPFAFFFGARSRTLTDFLPVGCFVAIRPA